LARFVLKVFLAEVKDISDVGETEEVLLIMQVVG